MSIPTLGRPVKRGIQRAPRSGDDAVRATDSDALFSRHSALSAGYLPPDPYTELLLANPVEPPPKRPVLINIGTALRSSTIDRLVSDFVYSTPGAQVVSLGAGSDTRFWRLHSCPSLARYVEVDFEQVANAKAARIATTALGKAVGDAHADGQVLVEAQVYALIAADLRSDTWHEALFSRLDRSRPTLFLYECVLAYLSPAAGNHLISSLAKPLENVHLVCYDMCIAGDGTTDGSPSRFGRVMLENLAMRHLELPGAREYTTPSAYAARFKSVLATAGAQSLRSVWYSLDADERTRLSRLEGLDEVEELEMLLGHYCIAWAHT